jgi:predicted ribosome quality control (RQC) complex YloA/Tae2 family protein
MDGLAIAASLREWERAVLGASVRTIYQPEHETFVLHLFARKNLRLLVSPAAAAIHLTELDLPNPTRPSPFVMLLRKHLRGGRIVAVCQAGRERAVTVEIESRREEGPERVSLTAELVGVRGNLILARDGRVLGALRPDPRAMIGSVYQPLPQQAKLDPLLVSADNLAAIPLESEGPRALVRTLDGVGKETARSILVRARSLGEGSLEERTVEALQFVLSHVGASRPQYDPKARFASFFPLLPPEESAASFSAALDRAFADRHESNQDDAEAGKIQAGLARAVARRERTLAALVAWLDEAGQAESLKRQGDLVLTLRAEIRQGEHEVALCDPANGEEVLVPLDPRKNPIENAQALYERAKKLRRGRPIVERRMTRARRELKLLNENLARLERGEEPSEESLALIPASRAKRRLPPVTSPRVAQVHGYTVQVGKSAAQNDTLLREARPDDLWLHAKGVSGSHVIVRQRGRAPIPAEVVEEAARLAARFSRARGETRVEVVYTPVKYVHKPKGARPGLVIVAQEDTLTVDPQGGGEPT